MGYSYEVAYDYRTGRTRQLLCCDSCGNSKDSGAPGVRKRTCPFTVTTASDRSPNRIVLPYCYPAALCTACYASHKATLHSGCREGAAASQADYDAVQARLEAGDAKVVSASGDWADGVPKGHTKVTFAYEGGHTTWVEVIVRAEEYDPSTKPFLSDYFPIPGKSGLTLRKVVTPAGV